MTAQDTSPEWVALFSDAVFAVLITILVLKLTPPPPSHFPSTRTRARSTRCARPG